MIADIKPGKTLVLDKLLSYGYSSGRSMPAIRDQVEAALAEAHHVGVDGLMESQRDALDDFWAHLRR